MRQPALSVLPRFAIFVRCYVRVPRAGLRLWLALALACGGLGLIRPPPPAQAATLTVTTAADSGAGSLRQAVSDALPGDTILFSLPNPSTILLASQITVNKDLTITGPGSP